MDGPILPPRFELIRELGSGATGTVLAAFDRELGKAVAMKVLHDPDSLAGDRLKQEFRIAAGVRHANLVRLGELFEHGSSWCFSMEQIEGADAVPWVARGTPGAIERTRRVVALVAAALAALHAAGIIHRDVRPSNVMVEPSGRVVLLDLGLASATSARATALVGAVEYLAPEVAAGDEVTPACDLYSLGALLFELLTGEPPFTGEPMHILAAKSAGEAPRASTRAAGVPADLDALCAALCARDPARRPSAAAVASATGATATIGAAASIGATATIGAGAVAAPLLGRDAELARLLDAVADPSRNRTRVVMVRGEAGVGKSALLDTFAARARDAGHLVCTARCSAREHLRWNAWEGLSDGLIRHLEALPPSERGALAPDDAGALALLFPGFARVFPAGAPPRSAIDALRRGAAAMRDLLGRVAARTRVVSILDDAHWGTDDSFALLGDVLAAPSPPVMVVFCVRLSEMLPPSAMARLAALRALPIELEVIDIEPLAAGDAAALARRLTSDPARATDAAAASGGNPLFLQHLVRAPGALARDLGGFLRERLLAASSTQRAILRVLAAAGRATRLDVVARAAGVEHEALDADLEALADAMLVRVSGVTRADRAELFHAAVAESVRATDGDDVSGLAAAHAALATALEAMADDVGLLVEHWVAAGDMPRAAKATLAAAGAARDALAHGRVAALCELVTTRPLPEGARKAIARARADALAAAGRIDAAAVAYQDAAAATTGDEALDLRRNAAELLLRSGLIARGHEVAARIGDELGLPLDLPPRALIGRIALERVRARLRGQGLATRLDEHRRVAAAACTSLAIGLSMTDALRAALFASRGVRLSLDSGDPTTAALALAFDGALVAGRGRGSRRRAFATLDRAEALAVQAAGPRATLDDRGGPAARTSTQGYVAACRGAASYSLGEFADAVAHCDRAAAIYGRSPGVEFGRRSAELIAVAACYWRGDWGSMAVRRAELAAAAAATGDRYAELAASSGFGVLAHGKPGDEPGARARLEDAAAQWPTKRAPTAQFRILTGRLLLDLYFGHVSAARFRIEAAWPGLNASRVLVIEHARATMLDLRGRIAIAEGDLATATESARDLERIAWAGGPAHVIHAAVACARRQVDDGLRALERAIAAADAHGLRAVAAAARFRRGELIAGSAGAADVNDALRAGAELGLGDVSLPFTFLAPWPDLLH